MSVPAPDEAAELRAWLEALVHGPELETIYGAMLHDTEEVATLRAQLAAARPVLDAAEGVRAEADQIDRVYPPSAQPLRCTCDYAGLEGENHKPHCEIAGGPHAECALYIHDLEAERDALRVRVAELEQIERRARDFVDVPMLASGEAVASVRYVLTGERT